MLDRMQNCEALIGQTPVVHLARLEEKEQLHAKLFAKLESANPTGSIKDRAAKAMVEIALRKGQLCEGGVLVEPTSGNTGIGLAFMAAQRGFRVILTMPSTMSSERRALLRAYGAELVLTPGETGMGGAIEKAKELCKEIPGAFMPNQFENPANPAAHESTTGPEIYKALDASIDIFVAGVGTGGTISGVGRYLKKQNPAIQVVAVEPAASPVLSGGVKGAHKIQGIGAGFVPKNYDASVVDEVVCVSDKEAFAMTAQLARLEGAFCGISSGAAVFAATQLAKRQENAGKTMVVILPDSGDRYLANGPFDVE